MATIGGYTGIDILARKPDAQVLIVSDTSRLQAVDMFPMLAVVGWDHMGIPKPDMLAQRDVVTWLGYGNDLQIAESLCGTAARVRVINGQHTFLSFLRNPRAAIAYAKANMLPYTPVAAPEPASPTPSVASAAVDPVARPVASVTPITEARTRQQAKAMADPEATPTQYSHDALALSFTAANPDWRYVSAWGKWLCWNGTYWTHDSVANVRELARLTCRSAADDAKARDIPAATIRMIRSVNTISAVETIARSDPAHARDCEQWDADPWALNTPGGIVDLHDGSIRPGRPEDHATRTTRAAPGGRCDAWYEFLAAATNGDADLMGFMARMAGYCLTGSIRDHALFFIHGNGGNGKGTFLNTLSWILGDYAAVASMEVFTEQHNPQHPTEVAGLMGRRMVSAQEVDEGKRWAEARINSLTGGDPITARFMRQDNFTFMPQFKLVIVGNHKPIFRNVGDAIRRRLHLIPFTHKIDKPDTQLADKLRAEASGILQWAIDGCLEWQKVGLQPPECVRSATDGYLSSQDTIATWIAERCDAGPGLSSNTVPLYSSYKTWCEASGEQVLGRKRFVEAMGTRGFESKRDSGNYRISGISVRVSESTQSAHDARFPDN